MKKEIRNSLASAFLLLPAAASLLALPSTALAQRATPELRSLQVTADDGLEAGSTLTITLLGTPRLEASVRIRGMRDNIELTETERGVYVGRYTIKRSDRIEGDEEVRATLRQGNRTASANYTLAEAMPRPRVVAPPPPAPRPPEMRIERFGMAPIERIEPGAELSFFLEGIPGARVTVDLPGVERDFALRETRPGRYEGSYTLRRADNLNLNRPIVATLRAGERAVTASLNMPVGRPGADNRPPAGDSRPPGGDNRPPNVVNLSPREGDTVPAGPPVQIGGSFEDRGGSGVDPASVQITLSGRNITRESQINRDAFSFRGVLPPGRHTVDVTARDQAGNAVRKGWSFDVAVPVPASLAVQVLNHSPNAEIGPDPVLVRGRTAPFAAVAVNVRALAPPGLKVDHTRTVFAQTLQADREGIFSFTLVPGIPVPGTRYDIVMVARRDNLSQESRWSLMQR